MCKAIKNKNKIYNNEILFHETQNYKRNNRIKVWMQHDKITYTIGKYVTYKINPKGSNYHKIVKKNTVKGWMKHDKISYTVCKYVTDEVNPKVLKDHTNLNS